MVAEIQVLRSYLFAKILPIRAPDPNGYKKDRDHIPVSDCRQRLKHFDVWAFFFTKNMTFVSFCVIIKLINGGLFQHDDAKR